MDAESPGSVESAVAGGCAYVEFCAGEPELLHLIWGAARPRGPGAVAKESGARRHAAFIDVFTQVLRVNGLGHLDPHLFSAPLWPMMHGFASLLIVPAEKLPRDPGAVRSMIEQATRAYFAGSRLSHDATAARSADAEAVAASRP
jgi:hypothetical protein